MIQLTINNKKVEVEKGKTVLEAALQAEIYVPNICYHPDLPPIGACRLCIVEIEGVKGYPTACTTAARDGMVVHTDTPAVQEFRKNIVWFLLSEHPSDLKKSSAFKKVVDWVGITEPLPGYVMHPKDLPVISDEPLFIRDMNRCILCGRCVRMCQEVRKAGTIGLVKRGIDTTVGTSHDLSLKESGCKFCLACVEVCPTGALMDKEEFKEEDRERTLLPCTHTCPAEIDVSRYVRLIAEGRFQDAVDVIRETVPFPYTLGCVCTHPCEEACRRGQVNEPIAIRMLKRFAAEKDSGGWQSKIQMAPDTGKKVAVVGAGPAGLTTAWFLRKCGHSVTVFEALPAAGGTMRAGIPEYRLPRNVLDKEIQYIEDLGVALKLNTRIDSLDELFHQGFHAIFLALGATEGTKMGIPGEDDPRVLDAMSVLWAINLGKKVDMAGDIAVVGGGNAAIDAARSALRKGAKNVTLLYRRTRDEMPASPEEVEEAIREGIIISFLVAPQKIFPEKNTLRVECIRMELGEPDPSGRRRPVPVKGSEFTLEVDTLIMAIGQKPVVPESFDLQTDRKGRIEVDADTLSTSKKGVFSGGDVVSGPSSVIEAIRDGRKAAISINRYLGGSGRIDQKFIPEEQEPPCLGREEEFAYKKRAEIKTLPVDERLCSFSEVEYCFDEKTAVEEAKRCLKCQLRLQISRAPLPPE